MAAKTTTATSGNDNGTKGAVSSNVIDTDIVLRNPTDSRILLPNTSTVVIGVNEVIPLNMENTNDGNHNVQATTLDNKNNIPGQENQGQINNVIRSMSELNK